MAQLYSNENFPLPVVEELRRLGHDVLTIQQTGRAEQALPDEEVLAFAIAEGRTISTRTEVIAYFVGWALPTTADRWAVPTLREFMSTYLLTLNRTHFVHLHRRQPEHAGIIVCTFDPDFVAQAQRIHAAIESATELACHLIRVNRSL